MGKEKKKYEKFENKNNKEKKNRVKGKGEIRDVV